MRESGFGKTVNHSRGEKRHSKSTGVWIATKNGKGIAVSSSDQTGQENHAEPSQVQVKFEVSIVGFLDSLYRKIPHPAAIGLRARSSQSQPQAMG